MNELKWQYSLSNHGTRQGFRRAAIETYTGNRIESLTREICQNSLDAKDPNLTNEPVVIQFKEFNLKTEKFPDINGYKTSLENIKNDMLEDIIDKVPSNYFKEAINLVSKKEISFLRISDFNTNGLLGINKRGNSPWNNLVKSEGVSDKDAGAGGSFGIGKNATFANSNLNTVFYSTLNVEDEKGTIGVANFPSYFITEANDKTQGVEYLSVGETKKPWDGLIYLDETFKRETPGTDIYIAGFMDLEDNETKIICSILDNYLYAIFDKSLIVEVNKVLIDKENLENLLEIYKEEIEPSTIDIYNLLTFDESQVLIYQKNIIEDEDIEIRIVLDPEGSRNISMIRKPWLKVDNFNKFAKHYSFYGLCLIKGKKLNALLRRAENPSHDKWEPRRDMVNAKQIEATIKKIKDTINKILADLHALEDVDLVDIFGAADFIPMEEPGDTKAQSKVKEKISNIEVKKTNIQMKEDFIQEYEAEGEFVIDSDGNIEIEVPVTPINETSETKSKNESKKYELRGEKVGIKRRALRVISSGLVGEYIINITVPKFYKTTNIIINALDEQGKIITNSLTLTSAKKDNKEYVTNENIIYNVILEEGKNLIEIKTNLKMKLGLGVEIREIKR